MSCTPAALARFRRYERTPRGKYAKHKKNARARGVTFDLSFEDWLRVWTASGRFGEPSTVMCRYQDQGAYAVGNVYIGTRRRNWLDREFSRSETRRRSVGHA